MTIASVRPSVTPGIPSHRRTSPWNSGRSTGTGSAAVARYRYSSPGLRAFSRSATCHGRLRVASSPSEASKTSCSRRCAMRHVGSYADRTCSGLTCPRARPQTRSPLCARYTSIPVGAYPGRIGSAAHAAGSATPRWSRWFANAVSEASDRRLSAVGAPPNRHFRSAWTDTPTVLAISVHEKPKSVDNMRSRSEGARRRYDWVDSSSAYPVALRWVASVSLARTAARFRSSLARCSTVKPVGMNVSGGVMFGDGADVPS